MIAGVDVHRLVRFQPFEYVLEFVEYGLPSGTSWTVQIGASVNVTAFTVNELAEPNGTYRYDIGFLPGFTANWSGTLPVNGSDVRINVTFRIQTFPVTFAETGLAPHTNWSVEVGSELRSSAYSSIGFALPNGSYTYQIVPLAGYLYALVRDFTVAGHGVTESIGFTVVTYLVQFLESGLPSGTSWGVTLASVSNSSSTPTVGFRSANGTDAYSIAPVAGLVTNWTGIARVVGTNLVVSIQFVEHVSSVEFTETGLALGTPWSISLGGKTLSSAGPTIEFSVPNGTYPYRVGPVAGHLTPMSSSIRVSGIDRAVAIDFMVPHGAGPNGLPYGIAGAPLVAGVAGLAILLGALALWTRRRRRPSAPSDDEETEKPPANPE